MGSSDTSSIDVQAVTLPGQLGSSEAGSVFPVALQCQSPAATLDIATEWLKQSAADLTAQAERHGAVLFRGFPIQSAEDFDAFVMSFGFENFPYEQSLSNAVRVNFTERIFSANEAPGDVTICLHHEMAQTPVSPSRLFFFCQKPSETGGATPLCRSDWLFERLAQERPGFAAACETHGLLYTNVMPPQNDAGSGMGRSWRSTFRADDPFAAEQRMTELGYSWEWLPDACLRATTPRLPAVKVLRDGRKTFYNQLIAAFHGWKDSRNDPTKAVTLGDGSPLDPRDVQLATELADELTFDTHWQQGDVVLVDNYVAMHGRRTFTGTRKVLASLVAGE
jgi:hypothetical protein